MTKLFFLGFFLYCLASASAQLPSLGNSDTSKCLICNNDVICFPNASAQSQCKNGFPCTKENEQSCEKLFPRPVSPQPVTPQPVTPNICDRPGIFPDYESPNNYYECWFPKNSSKITEQKLNCPKKTTFDSRTLLCLSEEEQNMVNHLKEFLPVQWNPNPEISCQDPGIYSYPEDCKKYFICDELLRPKIYSCEFGMYYSYRMQKCSPKLTQFCKSQLTRVGRIQRLYSMKVLAKLTKMTKDNLESEICTMLHENSWPIIDVAMQGPDDDSEPTPTNYTYKLPLELLDKYEQTMLQLNGILDNMNKHEKTELQSAVDQKPNNPQFNFIRLIIKVISSIIKNMKTLVRKVIKDNTVPCIIDDNSDKGKSTPTPDSKPHNKTTTATPVTSKTSTSITSPTPSSFTKPHTTTTSYHSTTPTTHNSNHTEPHTSHQPVTSTTPKPIDNQPFCAVVKPDLLYSGPNEEPLEPVAAGSQTSTTVSLELDSEEEEEDEDNYEDISEDEIETTIPPIASESVSEEKTTTISSSEPFESDLEDTDSYDYSSEMGADSSTPSDYGGSDLDETEPNTLPEYSDYSEDSLNRSEPSDSATTPKSNKFSGKTESSTSPPPTEPFHGTPSKSRTFSPKVKPNDYQNFVTNYPLKPPHSSTGKKQGLLISSYGKSSERPKRSRTETEERQMNKVFSSFHSPNEADPSGELDSQPSGNVKLFRRDAILKSTDSPVKTTAKGETGNLKITSTPPKNDKPSSEIPKPIFANKTEPAENGLVSPRPVVKTSTATDFNKGSSSSSSESPIDDVLNGRRKFKCPHVGLFRDPKDCHSYYRCIRKRFFTHNCPDCTKRKRYRLIAIHHTCRHRKYFSVSALKCVKANPLICP